MSSPAAAPPRPSSTFTSLVAVGVLYMGAHGKAVDSQAELDAVRAEIATLPVPTGPEIDASIVGDEATRATAVASVLGGRIAWDAVFADMAAKVIWPLREELVLIAEKPAAVDSTPAG